MRRLTQFAEWLAGFQNRRAGTIAVLTFAVAFACVPIIRKLQINGQFVALLPDTAPSVIDLEEAHDRVRGISTLTVAIQSPSKNLAGMQRLADALVPEFEASPDIYAVDWSVRPYEDFVEANRELFADRFLLEELAATTHARIEWERERANPFFVDLFEDEPPDPQALVDRLEDAAEDAREDADRYPDGYLVHPDRDLLVIMLRCDLSRGDPSAESRLLETVRSIVERTNPTRFGPDLHVDYTGEIVVAREEQQAIAEELAVATLVTSIGVLIVILIFFRSKRAVPLLGLTIVPPVLATFAIAQVAIGQLNIATAFLASIIIGNGINPSIIWLGRYFEERRAGHGIPDALRETHMNSWLGTLTAAVAAAISYGSLMATDFRGFRDFGIIGSVGMLLGWLSAFWLLPSLTVIVDRRFPIKERSPEARSSVFGVALLWLASHRMRTISVIAILLTLSSIAGGAWAISQDPLEYNFKNLRSERVSSEREIHYRVYEIVGQAQQGNTIVMMTNSEANAAALEAALEAEAGPLWSHVYSVHDLLPSEQEKKIDTLEELRELVVQMRPYMSEEQAEEIEEFSPPQYAEPLEVSDLPESMRRPFTERDGSVGRILLIEQGEGRTMWDGKYLIEWAKALRANPVASETKPLLLGRGPVFADIIASVLREGPRAAAIAFAVTVLMVIVAFRRTQDRAMCLLALFVGISWMIGAMALLGMKLNFLNFVAFPVTLGNGVDYGVNVLRRYDEERRAGNPRAIETTVLQTGGAVVLCSQTTVIGYSSLFASANLGINSFGAAMTISEITCLTAAVLLVPAIMLWARSRTEAREFSSAS